MTLAAHFQWGGRAFWPSLALAVLTLVSLPAELVANDRPLLVSYVGYLYSPVLHDYPETTFGGDFDITADFTDGYLRGQIAQHGWVLMPIVAFSPASPIVDLPAPAPTPPSRRNWLGTDSRQRDVLALLIYGTRRSLVPGLAVAAACCAVAVFAKRSIGAAFYLTATAVAILAALDFAEQGATPSLGALLHEGLGNMSAPWIGVSSILALAAVLVPLVLLGRALRHALDRD